MKNKTKVLSIILVIVTLLSLVSIPASAAIGYPMAVTIYYKNESGAQVAPTVSTSIDAAATKKPTWISPTVSGYVLKNSGDSIVTYDMLDKHFPASNYVRNGTATYTVYYTDKGSKTVTYVYNHNNTQCAESKTVTGKIGSSYSITSPTVAGYKPSSSTVSGTFTSLTSTSVVRYSERSYTVSFNANGGTGAPSSQTKWHFRDLTLSSTKPTRTGYSFVGWGVGSFSTAASYFPGGKYTSNVSRILYAVWSPLTYTVSYNANGGTGAPASQTKTYGQTLTLSSKAPTRSGYDFVGWGTSNTSTSASYQPGGSYTSNSGRTLYAIWKSNAPKTYTVSYNANGGSGAPASQTKTHGVTLTLSSATPTRSGYSFLGWSTSSSATSASYSAGGSYTTNASVTLYAVWSCNHSSTQTNYITGCDWEKICNTCGKVISTGTTHGPYSYGDWSYYSTSQHRRTKDCDYGDYFTYEYGSHNNTFFL